MHGAPRMRARPRRAWAGTERGGKMPQPATAARGCQALGWTVRWVWRGAAGLWRASCTALPPCRYRSTTRCAVRYQHTRRGRLGYGRVWSHGEPRGRGHDVDESSDGSPVRGVDEPEESPSHGQTAAARAALARAEARWQRRGYRTRYGDEFLVQLVGRGRPSALCLALGMLGLAGVVVGWIVCRSWQVVSLSTTPDGRVITHRQRSARPPAP